VPEAGRAGRVLTRLAEPRIDPAALLLDDTRLLVGGGYVLRSGSREPLASVEFPSIDLAAASAPPIELAPAALDRAFVALEVGGALAVGGCGPAGRADCSPCADGAGCISGDVWWIDPRGSAYALEPLPLELMAAAPQLLPGAGSAPWLIAGNRIGRFDPWRARFEVVDDMALGPLTELASRPLAVSANLFAWLRQAPDGAVTLSGFFHSQRGSFTQDIAPLLVGEPGSVVPERPPTAPGGADGALLSYASATGLDLAGASAAVSITDTDYADFTLDLTLASGPPPLLRLLAPRGAPSTGSSFGGLECPWPELDKADALASPPRLRVERSGNSVRLERLAPSGDAAIEPRREPCQRALPERVRIELVGTPLDSTRLGRLDIRRSLD
jgi:hypothetical protein